MLALFAAGFAAAAALSVLLLPEAALLTCAALCLSIVLLSAAFLRRERTGVLRRYVLLLCVGAAVGFLWTWSYTRLFHEPVRKLDAHVFLLETEVTGWPTESDSGAEVDVRAVLPDGGHAAARLYLKESVDGLRPGDILRVRATCRFAGYTAGGEETSYYTAKGILLTAQTDGEIEVERPARFPLKHLPAFLAHWLKQGIASSCAQDSAGLVTAIVTGDRSGLDQDLTLALRRTGLSHAVAVSGMHMAFLVALMSFLFRASRRLRVAACLLATVVFAMMTGGTPSVVRAAVMVDLLLIAPLFGRQRDDLTAMGAALLLLLAHDPYAVADVGLQLSFASVLGILLFTRRISERILAAFGPEEGRERHLKRLLRSLAETLGVTFGALVFTVPLTAVHFGSVSLIAPISNLISLWAVSLIFTFGIIGGAVGILIPALGTLVALPAALLVRFLRWIIPALARIPFAAISMEDVFCRIWLVVLYGILAYTLVAPGRRRVCLAALACVLSLAVSLGLSVLSLRSGDLTVQALDVGQGQSVLIRSGSSFLLYDCGGDDRHDAGRIAADHLERAASRTIRLLALSHYDEDHVNGVLTLLDQVNVKQIALPDVEPESPQRRAILERAEALDIPVRFVRTRESFPLDDDTVLTLMPPPLRGADSNERCLSLLCSRGEYDVLMTGDLDAASEAALLRAEALPDVELMLAGHHGSKYSNSEQLLRAVRPETVIVSVGAHNWYGHPAPEALERFEQAGAQVLRTDQLGTVTVQARLRAS